MLENDKYLRVKDILNCSNAELVIGNKEEVCRNFSKDTRDIKKDDIYIAIKGENFDGNDFWKEALDKGAKGVIIQNQKINPEDIKKYENKFIIMTDDTLDVLYEMAKCKRNMYDIPVIAITGSVGKTSTKDVISDVMEQQYTIEKTVGNNNNNIGLPFTILRTTPETEAIVLEMGMNHFGEIDLLSKIAKPNICVITNIGTSHIGNLGSRENILKAKLEILNGAENPKIIINNDNDLLHKWYENNKDKYDISTYGIKNESTITAKNIDLGEHQSSFEVELDNKIEKFRVPIGGEHFVLNSLSSILVGKILDIPNEKIKEGIENFRLTKNRMEISELKNNIKIINDAYNSSVESVEASLKYMRSLECNRKIAVLGDVLESGEYAKELHEKIGKIVAENDVDILICSGENSKYIVESAIKSGLKEEKTYYFEDRNKIEKFLKDFIQEGDVVLFKASNGMKFYEIANNIIKDL